MKTSLTPADETTASTVAPQPRADEPAIVLDNVHIAYGAQVALAQASLVVPQGRITALVGPSGCGKSSLLAAINRMTDSIPGCTVRGRVEVMGRDVHDPQVDVSVLRRQVGMVFQRPNPLPLSIAENILFPLRDHGLRDREQLQERLESALQQAGLWEEVRHRLRESALRLSGGQQQRLCLARALALEPDILLLDEPCSALDPLATERIEHLLTSLTPRRTLLLVTHNLGQARRVADHVVVCWVDQGCGCIVESGSADAIFNRPVSPVTRAYCGGQAG